MKNLAGVVSSDKIIKVNRKFTFQRCLKNCNTVLITPRSKKPVINGCGFFQLKKQIVGFLNLMVQTQQSVLLM